MRTLALADGTGVLCAERHKDFAAGRKTRITSLEDAGPVRRQRKVFLSRRLPQAVEKRAARYQLAVNPEDVILGPEALAELAAGCDYILTSAMQPIPRSVFQQLKGSLKAIGTLSVGYNHIDLDAAREFGVAVFYSPGVLSEACADLALMLLLNAARRGYEADSLMREGKWTGFALTQLLGVSLAGKHAGILGRGRIGQAVARRLKAFGIELHYHNRKPLLASEAEGAIYHATPEDLLQVSDVLFLLAPGSLELAKFLNGRRINLLPENPIVVNISRGETVDDDALIEALKDGRVLAAGLDVFAGEPEFDPRYRELKNVFLTPHIASATVETRNAMGFIVLDGLQAFEEGRRVENQLC